MVSLQEHTEIHKERVAMWEREMGSDDTYYKPTNVKDCQQPQEARREERDRFALRASRRNQPCWHLDFRILVSWTVGK